MDETTGNGAAALETGHRIPVSIPNLRQTGSLKATDKYRFMSERTRVIAKSDL